jgi:hypothetical protein
MLASQMASVVRPRPLGVTAGLYLLALLAACSNGTPPDEWAGRVCAALKPWRSEIENLNATAQREVSAAGTPTQVRTELLRLLDGGRSATESARASVAAAGTPDVDGGAEVAGRFVGALAGTRDAYARARTDLEALPTADSKTFYDGVVAVMTRLTQDYARSGVDTGQLDSPALREAFDRAGQCR